MNTQPTWVDTDQYPFLSHFVDIDGNRIHYVDEGHGPTILFVHGTPEWSFGFRHAIQALRNDFRCVAIDMLGFGLSDKPVNGDYTCMAHAVRLKKFVDTLALEHVCIVANDFGGGIALSYALGNPSNVDRIVLFNTWMRSLAEDKHFSRPARMIRSWLGRFLYLRLNFSVNVMMPAAYGNKRLLTRTAHRHYKRALPAGSRMATYVFARELMDASPWWQRHWERLGELAGKPLLFLWGMKDQFIPPAELERWRKRLPQARYVTFDDAGHFLQEEKPREFAKLVRNFLSNDNLRT